MSLVTIAWALDAILVNGVGDIWIGFAIVTVALMLLAAIAFLVAWRMLQVGATDADDGDRRGQEDPRHGFDSAGDDLMPGRTPEEIRASIEQNRHELGTSLVLLRDEVGQLTDWRGQVKRNEKNLQVAAVAAGLRSCRRYRRHAQRRSSAARRSAASSGAAAHSRNERRVPPTPSRPGPMWVPITGPISETNTGSVPKISRPRATSACA